MLKFVFNFRTRGVRVLFCVAGPTRPNCYLALCIIFVASSDMEKWWTHGGMKYVWIYISHIVIFSGLALELGHIYAGKLQISSGSIFHGCTQSTQTFANLWFICRKKVDSLGIFWNFATSIGFEEEGLGRFFVHSVIFHSAALHCDHCCFVLIKKIVLYFV